MTNFNLTVQKNQSEIALYLSKAADSVVEFGVHGVSGIGTIFNIITIILLANRKFEHNFYDLLRCRCVCNLAVCLLGIFFIPLPGKEVTVEYFPLVLTWFCITWPMRAAFFASVISDNLLISNRLANLYEKSNSVFFKLSKKVCFYALLFYTDIQK